MNPAQCVVCGDNLSLAIAAVRDPQTGEYFSILRCVRCGLGHTAPHPDDVTSYYGATYFGSRHGLSERMCMARRLRRITALGLGSRLLDFGCGDGSFVAAASKAGFDAVGVDIEPRHARARGIEAVQHLDDVRGTFDIVTLWHSLEHVSEPLTTMRAIVSRVAKDGFLVIAVPNFGGIQARCFEGKWFHLDVPRHLYHFTRTSLEALFVRLGLEVVRSWGTEGEIDLFGWPQSVLNVLLPAHPNVLFDMLTGRERRHGWAVMTTSIVFGTAATVLAAPLVPITTCLSQSAVLVLAARKA